MALTNAERRALKEVLFDALRELDPDRVDLPAIFNPESEAARAYAKAKVQAARDARATERAQLNAVGQARNTQLLAEIAVLDTLLAKFP